jgi:hypothetical protein
MTAQERLRELLSLTVVSSDDTALHLMEEVASAAMAYVSAAFAVATQPIVQMFVPNGEEMKANNPAVRHLLIIRTLRLRAVADAAAKTNGYLFERYGMQIPFGGVYSNDPVHLVEPINHCAVSNWAIELVCEVAKGCPYSH